MYNGVMAREDSGIVLSNKLPDALNAVDCYFRVAGDRLKSQESLGAEMHSRAYNIMSLSLALLATSALVIGAFTNNPPLSALIVFGFSGVFTLFIVTLMCRKVLSPQNNWRTGPNPTLFAQHLGQHTDTDLVEWAGDEYSKSVECNHQVLSNKADAIRRMIWLVGLQAAISATAWSIAFVG